MVVVSGDIWVVPTGGCGGGGDITESKPGMLFNSLLCKGKSSATKNYPAPNVSSAEVEEPCSKKILELYCHRWRRELATTLVQLGRKLPDHQFTYLEKRLLIPS